VLRLGHHRFDFAIDVEFDDTRRVSGTSRLLSARPGGRAAGRHCHQARDDHAPAAHAFIFSSRLRCHAFHVREPSSVADRVGFLVNEF